MGSMPSVARATSTPELRRRAGHSLASAGTKVLLGRIKSARRLSALSPGLIGRLLLRPASVAATTSTSTPTGISERETENVETNGVSLGAKGFFDIDPLDLGRAPADKVSFGQDLDLERVWIGRIECPSREDVMLPKIADALDPPLQRGLAGSLRLPGTPPDGTDGIYQ